MELLLEQDCPCLRVHPCNEFLFVERPVIISEIGRHSPAPEPPHSSSFREYGFFNLDLRQHLQLTDQPSRYWLIVSMGDYKTEILSFELK